MKDRTVGKLMFAFFMGAILTFFLTREVACSIMYDLTKTTSDSLLVVTRCHAAGRS